MGGKGRDDRHMQQILDIGRVINCMGSTGIKTIVNIRSYNSYKYIWMGIKSDRTIVIYQT